MFNSLVKTQMCVPLSLPECLIVYVRVGWIICISRKFPGDAAAAGPATTLREPVVCRTDLKSTLKSDGWGLAPRAPQALRQPGLGARQRDPRAAGPAPGSALCAPRLRRLPARPRPRPSGQFARRARGAPALTRSPSGPARLRCCC